MTVQTRGGTRSRFMAIVSYLGILCLVPLIMNRDDEFVYFHAKQGLIIWMWAGIFMLLFAMTSWVWAVVWLIPGLFLSLNVIGFLTFPLYLLLNLLPGVRRSKKRLFGQ